MIVFAYTLVAGATDTHRPRKENPSDACFDVFARLDAPLKLGFGDRVAVPLGIRIALNPGWECQVRSRSGNALNKGLVILNSPGTVDAGYRGELCAIVCNLNRKGLQEIVPNQKIAQIKLEKVPQAGLAEVTESVFNEVYANTSRGSKGFGSSGDM